MLNQLILLEDKQKKPKQNKTMKAFLASLGVMSMLLFMSIPLGNSFSNFSLKNEKDEVKVIYKKDGDEFEFVTYGENSDITYFYSCGDENMREGSDGRTSNRNHKFLWAAGNLRFAEGFIKEGARETIPYINYRNFNPEQKKHFLEQMTIASK